MIPPGQLCLGSRDRSMCEKLALLSISVVFFLHPCFVCTSALEDKLSKTQLIRNYIQDTVSSFIFAFSTPHSAYARWLQLELSPWLMLGLWIQSPVAWRRMLQQQLVSFSSLVPTMRPSEIQEVAKTPFIQKWNLVSLLITLLSL